MRLGRDIVRVAAIIAVASGAIFLLGTLAALLLAGTTGFSSRSVQSLDHEPISLEQAHQLINGGQVYRVIIWGSRGNADENCYSLVGSDQGHDVPCRWEVVGTDVLLLTQNMPTGVPILSDDLDSVGLTSSQFGYLRERIEVYNSTAAAPIEVLDQR